MTRPKQAGLWLLLLLQAALLFSLCLFRSARMWGVVCLCVSMFMVLQAGQRPACKPLFAVGRAGRPGRADEAGKTASL